MNVHDALNVQGVVLACAGFVAAVVVGLLWDTYVYPRVLRTVVWVAVALGVLAAASLLTAAWIGVK